MNRSVLLIDDDDHIREVTQTGLELTAGWHVLAASSGEEGVTRAVEEGPDAILLDVTMPGMDGPTTVGMLRTNDATKHIPVILLTGRFRVGDGRSFAALSISGVIAKPFDPVTLDVQVSRILGWES